ncbi:hypothetical protein ACFYYB_39865 [Streptomyces sp. NPDC002886]|uniref:hypothetical protein n=1 Tax=Streptomyces sp. NPDC002886 TaxID=3364667 RepID=UPI00367881F2
MPVPRLPPGPLRTLKLRLHTLYRAAGAPSVVGIAEWVAQDDELPGAPSKDTVHRLLGSAQLASLEDTVSVAAVLASAAGEEQAAVDTEIRALWVRAGLERGTTLRPAARWDPLRLGVHPAPDTDGSGDGPLPVYLERPHDVTLRRRLGHAAQSGSTVFVLLVGRSATGKTRAAWEGVREALPDWPVLFPSDARELAAWTAQNGIDGRTVLWLDEAQRYLSGASGEEAARAVLRLMEEVAPLAVVGTIWPEHLRRLTEGGQDRWGPGPEAGPGAGAGAGAGAGHHVRALLTGRHVVIHVPDALPARLPGLTGAAARDPRVAAALRAAGSSGRMLQHLTSGPALVGRWESGPDHWFSAAEYAVLTAALDARRLGHTSAVPARFLSGAAAGYLDARARATADPGWFTAAVESLTAAHAAVPAALIAERHRPGVGAPDGYRPDDYLDQHARRVRALSVPPAGFWEAARWARTGDDAHALATAAADRRRYGVALSLYERAAELGSGRARASWAVLLEITDGPGAAEAVAAGDRGAWAALGASREDASGPVAAEAAYARAAGLGDAWSWSALARIREGGDGSGDAVAEVATAAGHTVVWRVLGRIREARGDRSGGRRALERAEALGDAWGTMGLARLAERDGDRAEAVRHAERAAAAGMTAAHPLLVRLHWNGEDRAAAQEAARLGAAVGEAEGWAVLARLQEADDDPAGAAAAYRAAVGLGMSTAWSRLALMAERADDRPAAEEWAALASRTGDGDAWTALAELRQSRSDLPGADHAAREAALVGGVEAWTGLARARELEGAPDAAESAAEHAAEHGSPLAWGALSRMRERAGDRPGSGRAVRRAVDLGAVEAWTALGRVREDGGDTAGAERCYLRGAAAGDTAALAALGPLLAGSGRMAEAREAYGRAVDAGHTEAWEGLLSALATLPPRPTGVRSTHDLRRFGLPVTAEASGPGGSGSGSPGFV